MVAAQGPSGGVLAGVRVAVTRVRGRTTGLSRGLAALGAEVLEAPLTAIVPPEDTKELDAAARAVAGYDWVVLTSAAGVEAFAGALARVGGDAGCVAGVRVACIGPATAAAARGVGWRPALVAEEAVAESLLEGILREVGVGGDGARVLLPVAEGARDVLERGLREAGVEVDRVTAYRTVPDESGVAILLAALRDRRLDWVTFASPSAVEGVARSAEGELAALAAGVKIAAIGPITAAAARRYGLAVEVEATEHTTGGLLRALVDYYGRASERRHSNEQSARE